MSMDLGNISGVEKPIQDVLPVKTNETVSETLKTTVETKQESTVTSSQTTESMRTAERNPQSRLRALSREISRNVTTERSRTRHEVNIQRPRESTITQSSNRMAEIIKDAQRKYILPRSNDLVNRLNPDNEIHQMIRQAMSDPDLINPRKFFDGLSKMIPLAIATLNGNRQSGSALPADVSTMLAQMMKDLSPHINKLLAMQNLPDDLKGLLQQLAQQMGPIVKGEQLQPDTENMANKNLLLTMEQLTAQLQKGSAANLDGRQMLVTNLAMFQMMSGVLSLSEQEQAKFMRNLMANQLLFSGKVNEGMLGPNSQELAKKIAEMVLMLAGRISDSIHQPLLKDTSGESLFRLFSSILFGGALLGKMIADRGDGRPFAFDEAYASQLQMQSARELKIFDLIPFSLFASFPPVRERDSEQSEEQKMAFKLLMKLVRLLMELVFLITSIYSSGQKIGSGGVEFLLEKNTSALQEIIHRVIVVLKEVRKTFGVGIKTPLGFLRASREALIQKDYPLFWSSIFAFFTDENDLNAFLAEVEELDPFYQSIYHLINQES